jgi:thermostable 8-oxoguanine DNA glycosylase
MLFSILAAGKTASLAHDKTMAITDDLEGNDLFLFLIQRGVEYYKERKIGRYHTMTGAFEHLYLLNLATAALDDLLEVPGVGNKTARFFLMNTREDQRFAILDVHILRWLGRYHPNIPTATPAGNHRYRRIEKLAIAEMEKRFPGRDLLTIDALIWHAGTNGINLL